MSLYHTLLFFHVFGAFALIAGVVAMAPFALGLGEAALERIGQARLAMTGAALHGFGMALTIVFGLWLVAKAPQPNGTKGYEFFTFWVIGALVLWALNGWAQGEVARAARDERGGEGSGRDVRVFWWVTTVAATLILVLMIWKPGH